MRLVPITIKSIYKDREGNEELLPPAMAMLTEDAARSLRLVDADLTVMGGLFRLSDAYRDTTAQATAHYDWKTGKKKAYSPPAGESMHEAGRAIDIDLAVLIHKPSVPKGYVCIDEHRVRAVLKKHGWTPIADVGDPHSVDKSESWHYEFRSRFQKVYDDAVKKVGHKNAYRAMAKAAIADVDQTFRRGSRGEDVIVLQDKFVRLGKLSPNRVDGAYGPQTEGIVKEFQRAHDLPVTGEVDPATLLKLDEEVKKKG